MKKSQLVAFLDEWGQPYTETLGIDVSRSDDKEILKWFLAAVLFGAPITESSVVKTYRAFEKHRVLTPKKIIETGWDSLVKILDEGGYTRYDYKTADKLLRIMGNLDRKYDGSLNKLQEQAADSADLEKRLKELGKGMGDITVSIFLRELRDVWAKADPKPTPLVISAARNLSMTSSDEREQALKQLKNFWRHHTVEGKSFVNFETALLRWGKKLRRKQR